MSRSGGLFVGTFLVVGAVQAVTGFIPAVPSAAAPITTQKPSGSQDVKFTGTSAPVRSGSVPRKSWEELINKWGNLCNALTPSLLAAQLQQESGFNPIAKSPVGAQGMGQFMPATWRSSGLDANGDGKRDVFDPQDAIPSAASYDCKVAKSVSHVPGDNTDNMLAGYNAGSGAVKKYGGIPPYNETRNYVRVIKNTAGRFEKK